MGFLSSLKNLLPHGRGEEGDAAEEARRRIRQAWGLDDEEPDGDVKVDPTAATASSFDRVQWQKRARKTLDELPGSQGLWKDLLSDAHALGFEESWVSDHLREEFDFLIRRAVADRVLSEDEHNKLELARKLIGLTEMEAREALHAIVAEAEVLFGAPVKDEA